MDRSQKAAFVSGLHQQLTSAQTLVVAHYRGLTVKELTALRRQMRAAGGSVQVAKNRLAKLALKGTASESAATLLTGPSILAFSPDVITAARISQKFADANDKLAIIGGVMEGKVLSKAEIKAISQLPSLDELRGKLVGLLQAPGAQIARVLHAYATKDQPAAESPAAA
jgi:large subunit ribosomal protein L10